MSEIKFVDKLPEALRPPRGQWNALVEQLRAGKIARVALKNRKEGYIKTAYLKRKDPGIKGVVHQDGQGLFLYLHWKEGGKVQKRVKKAARKARRARKPAVEAS